MKKNFKKIFKCRVCRSFNIEKVIDLGNQAYTGKFPKKIGENIPITPLAVSFCINCKFLQLSHDFNNNYMYNLDYGYESGINQTMTKHLTSIVKKIYKIKKLSKKSVVLDIASNDGTLLNAYKKNITKIGIDPILNRFKKKYNTIDYPISDFFSYKNYQKTKQKKADVITAFSVFYDLNDPNKFLKDIKKCLDEKGIFVMEQSDLSSMIRLNSFDTICQEHCGYYSSKVIFYLMKKNNLKVFNHEYNEANGGSSRYYITHDNNNEIKINKKNLNNAKKIDRKSKIDQLSTFINFNNKIKKIKKNTINKINKILEQGKIIHGYGASTKGNVILQYYKINNKLIKHISDRNPFKWGRYSPGTKIKIISEEESRKIKPDYYMVLPWHFKKEILQREMKIRKKGTKFIFPLPKFQII
jgi:NDP-4-keto-2,6-dideoxyhexose 3-C-methyltransferase